MTARLGADHAPRGRTVVLAVSAAGAVGYALAEWLARVAVLAERTEGTPRRWS